MLIQRQTIFHRFEREIAGANVVASSAPQSFVIGASTFNAVQHQLSALRAQVYGPGVTSNDSNIPVNGKSLLQ